MNESIETQDNTAVYEVSYLLLPSVSAEEIPAKAVSLKDAVTSAGAKIISSEDPILIDLAYTISKVSNTGTKKADSGYFGWVKFEITKDGIADVKKVFDTDEDVLRHLIIKTVRENTLLEGKMKLKKEDKARKDEPKDEAIIAPEEVPAEVLAEDIDKTIDDLVIA